MKKTDHPSDPRGLIYEAYRMPDITVQECRAVFLDWALGIPAEADMREQVIAMLTTHSHGAAKHPMTGILRDALQTPKKPARRKRQHTANG